jgi:AcrR family transcriptional regulator
MGGAPKGSERHARQLEATKEEIKLAAWAQVSKLGAPSLSLRAVAASIGLSAPALYRYFPGKDHLVTALIIDAYESLAKAQDAVLDALEGRPWEERLRGLGQAYRGWATGRPAAFFLIFGDPIPGYVQPRDETMAAAGSSLSALIRVLTEAREAGGLALPLIPPPSPGLLASLEAWSAAVHHADTEILYLAATIASRVQGLTLVELGRQLAPFIEDGGELYARELERIILELKP